MSKESFDFWIVVALLFATAALWYFLALKPLWGLSLLTLVPTIYLSYRKKKNYQKLALGTLFLGICFGLLFDPIQVLNGVWQTATVLPNSIFGLPIVLDDIIGYAVMTLFMLAFYEHFLDDEKRRAPSQRWKKLALFCIFAMATILLLLSFHATALEFTHSYFKLGLIAIFFPIIFLIAKPALINKFALLTVFFFVVWLMAECVAVSLGNWTYATPSTYVGWVSFFSVSFPIEELILWMFCYAAVIISFYEYFIDDGR